MHYHAELNSQNQILGYYMEEIHGTERCQSLPNSIMIDEDLHEYLLSLGFAELIAPPEGGMYTMENKNVFQKVVPKEILMPPSVDERVAALEQLMLEVL